MKLIYIDDIYEPAPNSRRTYGLKYLKLCVGTLPRYVDKCSHCGRTDPRPYIDEFYAERLRVYIENCKLYRDKQTHYSGRPSKTIEYLEEVLKAFDERARDV